MHSVLELFAYCLTFEGLNVVIVGASGQDDEGDYGDVRVYRL